VLLIKGLTLFGLAGGIHAIPDGTGFILSAGSQQANDRAREYDAHSHRIRAAEVLGGCSSVSGSVKAIYSPE